MAAQPTDNSSLVSARGGALPNCEEKWCFTSVKTVRFRYLWSVKNFVYCKKEVKSPIFWAATLDAYKWQITITWKSTECLNIALQLVSTPNVSAEIQTLISSSLLNDKRDTHYTSKSEQLNLKADMPVRYSCTIQRNCGADDEAAAVRYWPEHSLTVVYDIEMTHGSANSEESTLKCYESSLPWHFAKLLDDQKYSDVTLSVNGGTEFRVHKAVLAARSDVFAAMFQHEFEENQTNRLNINDMDKDVVQEMLRFIYTGQSPNLARMVGELLAAADKYALEDLKQQCTSLLIHSITTSTAIDTLLLADRHNVTHMKELAMDFINAYDFAILETEDWERLKTDYPHLCIQLYERQHQAQITKKQKTNDGVIARMECNLPSSSGFSGFGAKY